MGDSIARSLDPAFVTLATEHGWTYVLQADNSCRVGHLNPADVTAANASQLPLCYEKSQGQQDELMAAWHPRVVVMADLVETLDILSADGRRITRGSDEAIALSEQALSDVARRITSAGARLALLKLAPRLGPECTKESNLKAPDCTFKFMGGGDGPQAQYDAMYDRLAATIPGVSAISITSGVCPEHVCAPLVDHVTLRWDGVHFTAEGAQVMVPTLEAQLEPIAGWQGAG